MSVSDSFERTESQRRSVAQRSALVQDIFEALRATFFSNRPSILPLALRPMAEEMTDSYLAVVDGQEELSSARALGRQRAEEGLGDDGVFRMGSVLRRFCHEHLDGDGFQETLQLTDAYIEALLKGYLQGRETAILQEQERVRATLQKVSDRYTVRMKTASAIGQAASSILDLQALLTTAVDLIREQFEFYYVGIFLVDESGAWAVLRAGTGEAGEQMLAAGHRLQIGGESMVGQSMANREALIASDVGATPVHFDNPLLPETHSEMALPLISRGQVIGAMTIQSEQRSAFAEEDITVLETMADQLANAILNARFFARMSQTLGETSALYEAVSSINTAENYLDLISSLRGHTFLGEADLNVSLVRFDRPWTDEERPEALITLARWTQLKATEVREIYPVQQFASSIEILSPDTPVLISDLETDPRLDDAARHLYVDIFHGRSTIFVPLVFSNRWIGYINAIFSEPRTFEGDNLTFLTNLASQVAIMVQLLTSLEAAHESTNLLRTVMSAIPNPIFYKDREGAYQIVNSAFAADVLGLPQERIEGSTVYDLPEAIPPDLADIYHEADMKLIREQGHQEYEADVKYADGERHSVLFNKSTLRDDQGNVAGMVGVMLDITERKRAEQEREALLGQLSRRAVQLQTAAEISQVASSLLDVQQLLEAAVALIRERFDLYYVGLFLLDDLGEWAVLRAATGEAGRQMLAAGHRLRAGGASMIGYCVSTLEPRIALDVGVEAVRFENPHLPKTRSEMALPLVSRGHAIGAMTIQSEQESAFSEADITVMETVARQLANAITNARLFAEAQARLVDLQKLQQQLTAETWTEYAIQQEVVGYQYDLTQLLPLQDTARDMPAHELRRDEIVMQQRDGNLALLAPLTLHEEPIGLLEFEDVEGEHIWSEDDLALIEAVREQLALALENRLLYQQTREALAETNTLYDVGRQISAAHTAEEIYSALVSGLSRRAEPDRIVVGLLEPQDNPERLRLVERWTRQEGQMGPGEGYPLEYWEALYRQIMEKGRATIGDIETSPLLDEIQRDLYRRLGVRSVVGLQIQVRGMPNYGIVLIYSRTPREFQRDELEFYGTVVRTGSVALENQLLLETTQEEAERRAFLNKVMQTASAHLHPEDLMLGVGSLIARHFQMPTILWQWDGQRARSVALHSAEGNPLFREERLSLRLLEMPGIGGVVTAGEPLLWNFESGVYGAASYKRLVQDLELEEVFSAPLMVRDEVLGVMTLGRQAGHPSIDVQEMAALRNAAVSVSVALENARLYQDAQETAEKLKEVDRLKSEFLANMSHELRTPLNSIIGFSRVILKGIDGPLTEMQQTDLEAIHESGKHLLNLINDVLDLSKIEAGKMEFVFEPTDLQKVASGVLSTAIALVKDKPVELQQDMPEDLPIVVADERRIRQVVLNLVGNAAKFTDEGYIRIFAEYDDEEITVAVEDTGVGIPPEKYDEVFAEFRQVDSSSTRRYGGTGLGLPVSKKFVEAHGGRIWFESEVGVGSTFYVALPIAGPPPEDEPEELAEVPVSTDGRVILTVDDDEGVITLFRRYLEQEGYQVVGLTRAASVVEEAKRIRPYAITLDILMPDRDGWQVIRDLKADPETRDIPVIVCSIVSDKDKGLSMGVSDYLVKPILEQELLDILARLSEESGPQRVLVVDDSTDDRQLLCRILRSAGYIVEEAVGGAEAIGKIHQSPPDVLILDLMMPEVDGFAVLENLKANEQTRKVPVVVVTAKDLTSAERDLLHSRAESLLQKGLFDQKQLLGDVTNALKRLSQHPQAPSGGGAILTSF
ncbi:MAG: GAF domain-containing protein [Anaerolineales bacterium]